MKILNLLLPFKKPKIVNNLRSANGNDIIDGLHTLLIGKSREDLRSWFGDLNYDNKWTKDDGIAKLTTHLAASMNLSVPSEGVESMGADDALTAIQTSYRKLANSSPLGEEANSPQRIRTKRVAIYAPWANASAEQAGFLRTLLAQARATNLHVVTAITLDEIDRILIQDLYYIVNNVVSFGLTAGLSMNIRGNDGKLIMSDSNCNIRRKDIIHQSVTAKDIKYISAR